MQRHWEDYHLQKKRKRLFAKRSGQLDVTNEEYQFLLDKQYGFCAGCEMHYTLFKKGLSVGHCHDTDRIRGLLCVKCNYILGLAKDTPSILIRLAAYLDN